MHGQLLEVGKGAVALGAVGAAQYAAEGEHGIRQFLQGQLDSAGRRHGRRQEARLELMRVGHQELFAVLGEQRYNVKLLVVKLAILK